MPRPRNKLLYGLFEFNNLNQIVCNNNKCGGKPLYKHNASLERHLRLMHPLIYSWYIQKKNSTQSMLPRRLRLEKNIINLMRAYPILWSISDENNFNEDSTNKAWKEISEQTGATVHMCKKKWEYLVEKYRSELDKMAEETSSSGTTVQQWKSGWKYFTELSFLDDKMVVAKKNTVDTCIPTEPIDITCIKEESRETFRIVNESLEDSTQCENEEIVASEEFKLIIPEAEESRPQDINNCSEPPDDSEMSNKQNDTQATGISNMPSDVHDKTDSEQGDYTVKKSKKGKRRNRKMLSESEDEDGSEPDTDKMFLLSLLPFLRSIPKENKLYVRHKIQGVLLDEQQKSKNV